MISIGCGDTAHGILKLLGLHWFFEDPMKLVSLLFFAMLAPFATDLPAADWRAVKGTYAVTAKNYLDPPEEEPKDSHLRFQLTGDAAKDLYQAMKVAEKPDECTGAVARKVGEMQCLYYKTGKKYACSFSIDIMRQAIEYGVAC